MTIKEIEQLYSDGRLDDAITAARAITDGPHHAAATFILGRIAWRQGHRGQAITLYRQALELDAACGADIALEQALEIMNFYHKDLYNP